jgi:hypothetical protein
MKCAIMQPTFNPWIGFFDMIDKIYRFVFYILYDLSVTVGKPIIASYNRIHLSFTIKDY